jgi:hypothetical protein
MAKSSFYLGIASIITLCLSILVGIAVEAIGIISLFRSIVMPLSFAAIVTGLLARRMISAEKLSGGRMATMGLIFGVVTLCLVILAIVLVMVLFLPLLFL